VFPRGAAGRKQRLAGERAIGLHFVSAEQGWELEMKPSYLLVRRLYGFTRNPMYVAAIARWFGWTVFYGSAAVLVGSRPSGPLWNSPWCRSRSAVWNSDGETPIASTGGKCRAGSAAGLFDTAVPHKRDCSGLKPGQTDGEQNLRGDVRNFAPNAWPQPRKGLWGSNLSRSATDPILIEHSERL
jgi:hypothetical protein